MYYNFTKPQNLFDYYHFNNTLSDSMISNIFEIISNLNFAQGNLAEETQDVDHRTSQVKWIKTSKETSDLFLFLANLINHANNEYFNFDIINSPEAVQYTEYNGLDKGKYDWHVDSSSSPDDSYIPIYRKLSLTIQLSDPSEYEGGDLEINIPDPEKNNIIKCPKEKGKIIIFPSYMWHRVTPVTKGVRKSLVWWVGGSPFR